MKSSIFLLLQPKESYKNSSKGAVGDGGVRFPHGDFPPTFLKAAMQTKRSCLFGLKNTTEKEQKKTLKFKVYVFRTQAQGLAGIIISRSSVTVNRLSLTSARVTHILYSQIHTHTHTSHLHSYCHIYCTLTNTISHIPLNWKVTCTHMHHVSFH